MRALRPAAVLLLLLLLAAACHASRPGHATGPAAGGAPAPPPVAATPLADAATAAAGRGVVVTPAIQATCAADWLRRQPDALADLDRDGRLERASVVREGRAFRIRLHRVPGLAVVGEWTVPGDYAEVGSTRCKGRSDGDLFLHVGVARDPKGNAWDHTVYHLEGGRLVALATDLSQSSFHLDLDGDGCVDPIVVGAKGGRAWVGGRWLAIAGDLDAVGWQGLPFGDSEQEAVDLDGDGDRDVVTGYPLRVVDVAAGKVVWTSPKKESSGAVLRWGGRALIAADQGDGVRLLATGDGKHALATHLPGASYLEAIATLDPAGDGSVLALHSLTTQIVTAARPGELVDLGVDLALPADDRLPSLGPVNLDGDGRPDLLGVRVLEPGSPMLAFPGSDASYELVLRPPPGPGAGRVIRTAELNGDLHVEAQLVDLEADGRWEILLAESAGFSSCDMKSSGSTSTLLLLDGEGRELWKDEARTIHFEGNPRVLDLQAHARPLDLWGDGRVALRVRAGDREWYLLPAGATVPEPLPACLE